MDEFHRRERWEQDLTAKNAAKSCFALFAVEVGIEDFRMEAFRQALTELRKNNHDKARQVLMAFSDPSTEPLSKAPGKGAVGAWPGTK
jgi:hypothetical protein